MREKYLPILLGAVQQAYETGEPIVRHMEYVFPGQGMERVMNQFMIGDRLLEALIHEKGVTAREVWIPKGKWKLGEAVLESSGEKMMLEQKEGSLVLERI